MRDKCVVCGENVNYLSKEIIRYFSEDANGARITKLCCNECADKTDDKWTDNGWVKINEI
jgi:hypothetical protein